MPLKKFEVPSKGSTTQYKLPRSSLEPVSSPKIGYELSELIWSLIAQPQTIVLYQLEMLIKFLLISSLPVIANVGLASSFYFFISSNTFFSQIAGIFVVFIWNYAASSKFVWNN